MFLWRFYGGTAVLYRKQLSNLISVVNNDESRIMALIVLSDRVLCYLPMSTC